LKSLDEAAKGGNNVRAGNNSSEKDRKMPDETPPARYKPIKTKPRGVSEPYIPGFAKISTKHHDPMKPEYRIMGLDLKIATEATRIAVISILNKRGSLTVGELHPLINEGRNPGIAVQALSSHLAILRHAGFVRFEKEGSYSHYMLTEGLGKALGVVTELLEKHEPAHYPGWPKKPIEGKKED
jgi:DNA-binding transcriptional ArsR family regulator